MASTLRGVPIRRDLNASMGDAIFFSLAVGLGEAYLIAFFLACGLSEIASGLIATVPILAGACLQLASPLALKWVGSYRRWIVLCGLLQASMFLPLIWFALQGAIPTWLAFAIATVYYGAGMATGPAWNAWMGRIVPRSMRAPFFAVRTRAIQAGVLCGLIVGGTLLQQLDVGHAEKLFAFAVLFWVACFCRVMSITLLGTQSEPPGVAKLRRLIGPREILARLRGTNDGKLLRYMFFVQIFNFIAVPFLAAYMLRELQLSYLAFMTLIAIPFISKTLLLPALGDWAKRYGPYRLLWVGGLAVIPLSAAWALSPNFYYLAVVQVFAGAAWATYELSTFLLFFETIHEDERASVLTTFNLLNAGAMVTGSTIGSYALWMLGNGTGAYLTIFVLASCGLLATVALLTRVVSVDFQPVPLALRALVLRPLAGSIDEPVLHSIDQEQLDQQRLRPAPVENAADAGSAEPVPERQA
jgi:MFS family permease